MTEKCTGEKERKKKVREPYANTGALERKTFNLACTAFTMIRSSIFQVGGKSNLGIA